MTEIIYRGDWPDDVRTAVAIELSHSIQLIPSWCRILYIRFEATDPSSSATIQVNFDARWATIRVQPGWMEETPEDRRRALIHEVVHLHMHQMRTIFHDLTEGVDATLKAFAWERYKEAWEGATEDLAWAFDSFNG